jgi:hypothetical protein
MKTTVKKSAEHFNEMGGVGGKEKKAKMCTA